MTKMEFTDQLRRRLAKLPDYEISKTIAFYTESIDDRMEDGMSEADAVASVGDVDKIVSEILIDTPLTTLIQKRIKDSHSHSSHKTLWMVLAICGFPFWLPLALAGFALFLALYITIWAVVVSLCAAELALLLFGVFGLAAGVATCFSANIPAGLALIGAAIFCAGLFIMTIKPLFWVCKQIAALTVVLLVKIKSMFVAKKEETV